MHPMPLTHNADSTSVGSAFFVLWAEFPSQKNKKMKVFISGNTPFEDTTTVKAIAVKNGVSSSVASRTFIKGNDGPEGE